MRKVCIITGTRAEYGLLYPLIDGISKDKDLSLQLIVTGMHLSAEFGNTYKQIEADGFKIDKKIEILLSSDTPIGISKSIGLGHISFAEAYQELQPDIILVLGDRTEIFAATSAALIANIPIAHMHGGEVTEGAYDEAIRHSITKMSHLHFTSTEKYKNRIIQMGENPDMIFNFGAIAVENIKNLKLLERKDLESALGTTLKERIFLITFHPVTLENQTAENQTKELLAALDLFDDASLIITKPNADKDGRIIIKLIDEYAKKNPNAHTFNSLGTIKYLSVLKHANLVIGNSSSGILEAPSFKTPTINIGERQKGRIMCASIINCDPYKDNIIKGINMGLSKSFNETIAKMKTPYGDGNVSSKIIKIIKETNLSNIIKKRFFDLKISI